MWSVIKLGFSAIVEAVITGVAFALAVIVVLWGANGFPEATLTDFCELVGWFGAIGVAIVLVLKLVEFGWVVRLVDTRGRAFDSAYTKLYETLANRDIESARYWLSKLESRRQPLYDTLSHCAKWRGVNSDVITSTLWQVLDRPRIAREDILVASASAWRPRGR